MNIYTREYTLILCGICLQHFVCWSSCYLLAVSRLCLLVKLWLWLEFSLHSHQLRRWKWNHMLWVFCYCHFKLGLNGFSRFTPLWARFPLQTVAVGFCISDVANPTVLKRWTELRRHTVCQPFLHSLSDLKLSSGTPFKPVCLAQVSTSFPVPAFSRLFGNVVGIPC